MSFTWFNKNKYDSENHLKTFIKSLIDFEFEESSVRSSSSFTIFDNE